MPTLNVLMCAHTMLSIVENPAVSTRAVIEANRRVWGLMASRHAFIVGILQGTRLRGIDQSTPQINYCWGMS